MTEMHEGRDADIHKLVGFGLGLSLLVALVMVAMWLLFRYLEGQAVAGARPSAQAGAAELLPLPRLQVSPAKDLEARRAAEDAALNSYRWVDKDGGVVGIPIERAMDVLAARGLGRRAAEGDKR